MKKLNEYETPETDKATCMVTDIMGAYAELTNPKTSRELERKLAMCRDTLRLVADNYNGQLDCLEVEINDVLEALEQTK